MSAPLLAALALLAAANPKAPAKALDAGSPDAGATDAGAPAPKSTLTQVWADASLRGPVLAMAFSPDGKLLAVGSGGKNARLVDAATGKVLKELPSTSTPVSAVAFSPDGKLLAVGEQALAVHLYRTDTGKLDREFPHPDSVSGITFSPDGALLAVAGHTATGELYTLKDGKRSFDFQGRNTAFSSDGKRMVSAVPAGALRVWDVATGKAKGEVSTAPHAPWLSASADLSVVLTYNPADKALKLWNASSLKPIGELKGHEKGVFCATLSADGAHAASTSEDHTLRLWDVAGQRMSGHSPIDVAGFVALSADGTRLAVAQGNRITLYTVAW